MDIKRLQILGIVIIVLGLCTLPKVIDKSAVCIIKLNDDNIPWPTPLILKPNTLETVEVHYALPVPGESDIMRSRIEIKSGESIMIACTGPQNYLKPFKNRSEIVIECIDQYAFRDPKEMNEGAILEFNTLSCASTPKSSLENIGECINKNKLISTGYRLSAGFKSQIEICFNNEHYSTIYTKHKLLWITYRGRQIRRQINRPMFQVSNHYEHLDVNQYYTKAYQNKYIPAPPTTDIDDCNNYRFDRGHYAPCGDFIFVADQDATFWYLNSGPQWQFINNNYWNSIEDSIRHLAFSNHIDLTIWTGVGTELATRKELNREMKVFLAKDKSKIPVAKYFWKIVYYPTTERGVAFISLNNPFYGQITSQTKLCQNICKEIRWLHFKSREKASRGYAEYEKGALRKRIPQERNPKLLPGDENDLRSPPGARNDPRSPPGTRNDLRSPPGARNDPRSPPGARNDPRSPLGAHNNPRSPLGAHNNPRSSSEFQKTPGKSGSNHSGGWSRFPKDNIIICCDIREFKKLTDFITNLPREIFNLTVVGRL